MVEKVKLGVIISDPFLKLKDSFLFKYYQIFQPKTYGDVYHLNKTHKLHHLEATNYFHPWIHKKPTNQFRCGLFGPKAPLPAAIKIHLHSIDLLFEVKTRNPPFSSVIFSTLSPNINFGENGLI